MGQGGRRRIRVAAHQHLQHETGTIPPVTSTTTDAPDQLAYQPALDGLRALAVAAVVIFHLDQSGLTGGFLGVDTFFVLSGFLITTLLVLEWRRNSATGVDGTIAFATFWARRARRLLPALILMMIAVAIFAAFNVAPTELGRLRGDGFAGLFYVANWRFVFSGQSYFDLFNAPSPFRHLWSLAIEEQFYLVWPVVTLVSLRLGRGRLRVLALVAGLGAIASIALMATLFEADDPSRAYYGTDTHAHTILIGVLLALVLVDVSPTALTAARRRAADGMGVVALVVILVAFASAHDASSWLYHGGSPAFAVAVAALIGSIMLRPRGFVGRALAVKPFVALGVISYGVYLWHWPVIVYATESRVGISGLRLAAFRIVLTLGAAIASYLFVERPIRAGLRGRATWIAAPAGLAAGAVAIMLGTTGAVAAPSFLEAGIPAVTSSTTLGPPEQGNPIHVVLVGDSLAASLGPGLDDALTARGIAFEADATPGCSILRGVTVQADGRPYPWSRACAKAIFPALRTVVKTEPRPDLVLWFASWDAVDRDLGGRRVRLADSRGRVVLGGEVKRAAALLTAQGARLMILTVPSPVPGTATVLPGLDEARRVRALNAIYRDAGPTRDGRVSILDLAAIVCPDGRCPAQVANVELRPDGSHFGPDGAKYVGAKLTDAMLECWRDPETCRS